VNAVFTVDIMNMWSSFSMMELGVGGRLSFSCFWMEIQTRTARMTVWRNCDPPTEAGSLKTRGSRAANLPPILVLFFFILFEYCIHPPWHMRSCYLHSHSDTYSHSHSCALTQRALMIWIDVLVVYFVTRKVSTYNTLLLIRQY